MTHAPRALIAEDEPLLAEDLRQALARAWPELQIAAMVGDGLSAARQALALQPDVLFFDIRMPGQSGLEAAAELADAWPEAQPFPILVFVTAYDQYAMDAFEAQAVDYLLKPVQPERLARSVQRLRELLAQRTAAPAGAALAQALEQLRHLAGATAPAATATEPPLQMIQAGVGTTSRPPTSTCACSRPRMSTWCARRSRSCCPGWTPRISGRCTVAPWCAQPPLPVPSATRPAGCGCSCASELRNWP